MTLLAGVWSGAAPSEDELRSRATRFRFSGRDDLSEPMIQALAADNLGLVLAYQAAGQDTPVITRFSKGRWLALLGFTDARIDANEMATSEILAELESAEGEFAAVLVDPEQQQALIVTDRFGARPVYYINDGHSFFWSTHIAFLLSLAGRAPQFDPLGVLQMTQLSHTLDGRTPYSNVKRVRPATIWKLEKRGFGESCYWRLRYDVDDSLDPNEHARRAFSAIQSSTASRCAGRTGFVSLSGGLDSRLVATGVPSDRFFAATRHIAGSNDHEIEVARRVAMRLGLRHEVENVRSADLLHSAERMLRLTGGVTPLNHGIGLMETIDGMIRSGGFKVGGGPGDVLAGSYVPSLEYTQPSWTSRMVEAFAVARPRFNRHELSLIFRPELVETYAPQVLHGLRDTLAQCDGPTAAHRVSAWAMVFRQPAFTFSSPIAAHPLVSEASPHLGHQWTDLFLKLPATWIFRRNFYTFLIHSQLETLRDVIYANTGKLLPPRMIEYRIPGRLSKRERIRSAFRGAAKNELVSAVTPFLRARLPVKGRGAFGAYGLLAKNQALLSRLRDAVDTGPASVVLDRNAVYRYLDGVEQGRLFSVTNGDHPVLLGVLATLCLTPGLLAD